MWYLIGAFVIILLFLILVGAQVTNRAIGILIDIRNKISLSQFQIVLWTWVLLSGFSAIVIARLVAGVEDPLGVSWDERLWGLLGISLASAVASGAVKNVKKGKEPIALDSIKDNYEITQVKLKSPRTGVFYVGGGTPKNYISQVEVIQEVMGYPENPHMYAAQITTDVPQWGGLSGCTFEESQSWGKFHKDAKMAQSLVDATIGLPILVGYLLQKGVAKKRKQKRYTWEGEELLELK